MVFFGGFSFSFKIALSVAPVLAYISLISPYTYATEAIRSAALGAKDFMPILFFVCFDAHDPFDRISWH